MKQRHYPNAFAGQRFNSFPKTGRHRFFGDTFESASASMGLPPVTGLRVDVQAKVDMEITGGNRYQTPEEGRSFRFDWRYPSAAELTGMIWEIKQYLRARGDLEKNLSRMNALIKVPQVRDGQTLDDYLLALKASAAAAEATVDVPTRVDRERAVDVWALCIGSRSRAERTGTAKLIADS